MKKQLVLAVLLAVSMSAVRAEEKTTFQKVKDVTCDVVTHPATKITAGLAITVAAIFMVTRKSKHLEGNYLIEKHKDVFAKISKPSRSRSNSISSISGKVGKVAALVATDITMLSALGLGLGLIGSGIKDIVERVQSNPKKV